MQCVNCQFENMPGTRSCVRCGTSLTLAAAAISIHPPRPARWWKEIRRWVPMRYAYHRVSEPVQSAMKRMAAAVSRDLAVRVPSFAACLRMIVPGWAHLYEGHTQRGRLFLRAWLGLLAVALLCHGSTLGAIALGLLFATHVASILDLLFLVNERNARNLVMVGALAVIPVLAVYGSLGFTLSRVVESRQLLRTESPFDSGDVVLFHPRAVQGPAPQPGQVVIYRNTPFNTTTTDRGVFNRVARTRIDGQWVDRVLAGPGSKVLWNDGKLWVNGQQVDYGPLNRQRMPQRLEVEVPADSLCIMPSTDPYLVPNESNCIVSLRLVLGNVWVRNYPLWRFWWIR